MSITAALISCSFAYANSQNHQESCLEPAENCSDDCCCSGTAFVSLGGGYAWSFKTDIKTSPFWDPSPQGYNDDLNQSEFYTIGLGYHFDCSISALFELAYRPSFNYKRFQTSEAVDTPGFLGSKVRHFNLSNIAYTFNLFFNKDTSWWGWNICDCYCIAPFIGAGFGVGYNTVTNFHSVLPIPPGQEFPLVHSISNFRRKVVFTGQAMGGIVTKVNECLSFEIGYRWFYGGKFRPNNYVIDVLAPDFNDPVEITPWKGTLMTNEIFLNLIFSI